MGFSLHVARLTLYDDNTATIIVRWVILTFIVISIDTYLLYVTGSYISRIKSAKVIYSLTSSSLSNEESENLSKKN